MRKFVCLFAGLVIAGIAAALWSLLFMVPATTPVDAGQSLSSRGGGAELAAARRPAISARAARAVVPCDEYDFHIMDPGQTDQHTFFIHNDGDVPLTLKIGPTTCKCTLADLPQSVIAPGEKGSLRVQWTTLFQSGPYVQSASVLTNDPLNPKVQFTVYGSIRAQVGLDPESLVFPRVSPDRPVTQTALVYSQVWPQFSIRRIECPIEGLAWDTLPAPADALAPFHARSGFYLRVTLPTDLPAGLFSHSMRLHVDAPSSPEEPPIYEVGLSGRVLRRLCVYGSGIDGTGMVYIGPLEVGEGARVKLLIKVRDRQRELAIDQIQLTPNFLRARVAPHETTQERCKGLYDLEIEVPPDAPRCVFMGSPPGRVRIVTRHPRIPELDLPVKFAVIATR